MSTKNEKQTLTAVAEELASSKQTITNLLKGTIHAGSIGVAINASFDKHINQLGHMGSSTSVASESASDEKFPPITNFMGEDIEPRHPVKAADLKATPSAAEAYAGRVNDLYATFTERNNEQIQNSHMTKEDQKVLRGVAKKAGLEDFRTRAIDNQFIEDIKAGIRKQEAEDEVDEDFEAELKNISAGKAKGSPAPKTEAGKASAKANANPTKEQLAADVKGQDPVGEGHKTSKSTAGEGDTDSFPDNLENINL